jgi:putative flippase GtrA
MLERSRKEREWLRVAFAPFVVLAIWSIKKSSTRMTMTECPVDTKSYECVKPKSFASRLLLAARDRIYHEKGTIARFVLVGSIGFCVDALALEMLLEIGLGPLIGQLYAASVAILVTFVLNRTYTFADTETPILRLFIAYLGTQCAGIGINYLTYTLLLTAAPPPICLPLVALAAASGVAMVLTYAGSRLFVFKSRGNGFSKSIRPRG